MSKALMFSLSLLVLFGCHKDVAIKKDMDLSLGEMLIPHPSDNIPNKERVKLGRYLFYNPAISIDSSVSCGSCHNPSKAFAQNEAISKGVDGRQGFINAPSLANIGNHPYFTSAGGVPTLEMQILVPIQEEHELNFNIVDLAERLKQDSFFKLQADKAYPGKPYHYVITRSIAAFERTFVSTSSKFDQYLAGKTELSQSEKAGMKLFYGEKANCYSCHGGINFTNYDFESNGLTKITKDSGRYRLTKQPNDIGKYKIPSLRNLKYTFPYMHDGSIKTLSEVIEHYSTGNYLSETQSKNLKPIHLSHQEKEYLIEFLNTLNDVNLITNPNLKP